MTREQLLNSWLRIGFSSKGKSKLSDLGRRRTGEKGIGRISTDRLGAELELITKTELDGLIGLKINWNAFEEEGKDVFDIDIELTSPEAINIPIKDGKESKSGTEIKITQIRQKWSNNNIENLYYELSSLTPPFNEVVDFEVDLKNDILETYSKKVKSDFYEASEIELTAMYSGIDSDIIYTIKDKHNPAPDIQTIKWQNLISRISNNTVTDGISENLSLGPVTIKLLFYLREAASVAGTGLKLADLRTFLNNNAGVKIYRDNFAVKPYGFPSSQFGNDWIELGDRKLRNPAGIGRSEDYMINPNQLVGAVFITRDDNPHLIDSAAREGLVESESFSDLKALVLGSILVLESHRVKIFPQIQKTKQESQGNSGHKEAEKIISQLSEVKEDLEQIQDEIIKKGVEAKPEKFLKPIARSISSVDTISKDVDNTVANLLNWQRVVGGMATLGISSAVFGHETETSILQVKGAITAAKLVLEAVPPDIAGAIEELEKALKDSKRIAEWGAYALRRVQHEKRNRRNTNIKNILELVATELQPAFQASSINLIVKGDKFLARTYPMDIESILINLLTNAYTAASLKGGKRIVQINVEKEIVNEKKGFHIYVSDTGPGIAPEYEHRIFDPLFSTKVIGNRKSNSVGTGLGLTIVKSITEELGGQVTFDKDPILQGARFKIWIPQI